MENFESENLITSLGDEYKEALGPSEKLAAEASNVNSLENINKWSEKAKALSKRPEEVKRILEIAFNLVSPEKGI